MKHSLFILPLFLAFLVLLTGCGEFSVKVEPVATAAATPMPLAGILATQTSGPATVITETLPAASVTLSLPTQALKPGTSVELNQLQMIDSEKGWAIGDLENDQILRLLFTQDGGLTWKDRTPAQVILQPAESRSLAITHFISLNEGWVIFTTDQQSAAVTNQLTVWHTYDAGISWEGSQPIDLSDLQMEFHIPSDLNFLDAQHGWVMMHLGVGMSHDYIAILTTADGGKNWKRVTDPGSKAPIMSCSKAGLTFITPTSGWLLGDCPGLMPELFFFKTEDGGQNWVKTTLPVPDGKTPDYFSNEGSIGCGFAHVDFSSSRVLGLTLVCHNFNNNTAQAWLYSSANAGVSWEQHLLPLANMKSSFYSSGAGFLLGSASQDPGSGGIIYHSIDGGSTWTEVIPTGWTGTLDFVDDFNGWVIAEQNQVTAFVRTRDGGKTWIQLKPVIGE